VVETYFVHNGITYKATYSPPNLQQHTSPATSYTITKDKIQALALEIIKDQDVQEIKTHEYQATFILDSDSTQVKSIAVSKRQTGSGAQFTQLPSQLDLKEKIVGLLTIIHPQAASTTPSTLQSHPSGQTVAEFKPKPVATPTVVSTTPLVFPGLANQGSVDCWANALLQTIITVPSLTHAIKALGNHYKTHGTSDSEKQAGTTLINEIETLAASRAAHQSKTTASSRNVRNALVKLRFLPTCSFWEPAKQEDAHEYLFQLLARYEQIQPPGSSLETTLPGFVITQRIQNFESIRVLTQDELRDKNYQTPEDRAKHLSTLSTDRNRIYPEIGYPQIKLDLKRFQQQLETLRSMKPDQVATERVSLFAKLIGHYFNPPIHSPDQANFLIEDAVHRCEARTERVCFQKPPEEFIMLIDRFTHQGSNRLGHKFKYSDGTEVNAPIFERFTLSSYYTGGADTSYEVDSFVVHTGNVSGGHYYSYQKLEGQWYCFNDTHVHQASTQEVEKELGLSYFQHYKKLEAVDSSAIKLPLDSPSTQA
jgi:ubiquitin C-terminal hydrolase